ncbi:hypothetical protein SynA1562_01697 [Synechococcus sp. A15-62]|nr:hypothetical protein SynA1562_01697 [Synechococcus sp. A15-62]
MQNLERRILMSTTKHQLKTWSDQEPTLDLFTQIHPLEANIY